MHRDPSRLVSVPLRKSVEDRELRLDISAHYGAIADFYPGVRLKLIRIARDAVKERARNVPAAKHEVSCEALRKTNEGQRAVAHHSADRPLNPSNRLSGLRLRNGRLGLDVHAHPGSEPLHGKQIKREAEEGEHAQCFYRQGNVGGPQLPDTAELYSG